MTYIHDTRDKPGKHKNVDDYLLSNGHRIIRSKLFCGDISLLNNQSVCIDLKQGLQEVYSNVIQDHPRLKREIIRAQSNGIRLIFLVEQPGIHSVADVAEWDNPRLTEWNRIDAAHKIGKLLKVKINPAPPASSHKVAAIMSQLSRRYGAEWEFCSKEDTGRRVVELLGGMK
jgi:hypothetical protein